MNSYIKSKVEQLKELLLHEMARISANEDV